MMHPRISRSVLGIFISLSACSGGGIGREVENSHRYYGCYNYGKNEILIINQNFVINIKNGETNKVNGFTKIRDSDFILTQNQILFDKKKALQFTSRSTGFQYEYKSGSSRPTLLVYDDSGNEFALIKSGDNCLTR